MPSTRRRGGRLRIINSLDIQNIQQNVVKVNECFEWQGRFEKGTNQPDYFGHRVRKLLYTRLVCNTRKRVGLSCKNFKCINVNHMVTGKGLTGSIAAYKGVTPAAVRGEDNFNHILYEEDVQEIRNLYANTNTSYRKLGLRYNVHQSTIGLIIRGKNWFWLEQPTTKETV